MAERLFDHLTVDGDEAKLDGAVIKNLDHNEDFSELKSDLTSLNYDLIFLTENGGLYHFPKDIWINGGLAAATGAYVYQKYRIVTENAQKTINTVICSVESGYELYLTYYTDATATTVISGKSYFKVSAFPFNIPDNTYFKAVIRKATEDKSITADIDVFRKAVTLESEMYSSMSSMSQAEEYDKQIFDKYCTSFYVYSGSNHSSGNDQIPVNIKSGEKFYVLLYNDSGVDDSVSANVYTFDSANQQVDRINFDAGRAFSHPKELIASGDTKKIGVYVNNGSDTTAEIRCYIIPQIGLDSFLLDYITGKNVKAYSNIIKSPLYEVLNVPSAVLSIGWSDFFINDGKIWFFKQSGDETHVSTTGKIVIYDMSNWTKIAEISHNFGHCNTVSYDQDNDVLCIGNLPGNDTYPGALYLFYGVSDWESETSLDFETLNPTIVDLRSAFAYNAPSATFGENNGAIRNIVYVSLSYGKYIAKILLGMGENQLEYGTYTQTTSDKYNGTYDVLAFSETTWDYNNSLDEVWQGCDFIDGAPMSCNGDSEKITASKWHFNATDKIVRTIYNFDVYKSDGTNASKFPEGLAFNADDGFVYMGMYYYDNGANTWHLVRYKP